jgi:hypothetical protein
MREEGAPKGYGRPTKGYLQISSPLDEKETSLTPKEISIGFSELGIRGKMM